ncbi:hypothetical protein [Luteolibacter sp. LG18]|uniref:hypothetical protein n=1 Tax=Luteolibacter sp. LG18 TaxID=2819286 RepID=UPI002B2871F7|nr:hypothetical protein llg_43060 [Luteolibacter sp. LG18]
MIRFSSFLVILSLLPVAWAEPQPPKSETELVTRFLDSRGQFDRLLRTKKDQASIDTLCDQYGTALKGLGSSATAAPTFAPLIEGESTRLAEVRKNFLQRPADYARISLDPGWADNKEYKTASEDLATVLRPVMAGVGTWKLPPHAQSDFGSGSTILSQPYLTALPTFVDAVPQLKGLKPAKARVPVGMPGFPKKSFYYHSYDGSFDFPVGMTGVTFNRLYIVTDPLDQVVALQYCCEAPPNHSVRDMGIGIFNFVQFRRKGSTTARVEYETRPQKDGSALVITKLGVEERRGSTSATCKEINVLELPKPTLQLIDYVLQQP